MEQERRLVLAGDPETGEIYAVRVIDEEKRGHPPSTNPMIEICRVARYPDQRAIHERDVALELPALAEGTILRMSILKELTEDEQAAFLGISYAESLRNAQETALAEAATEKEREIIRRHLDGVYLRRRRMRTYTRQEVKVMLGL